MYFGRGIEFSRRYLLKSERGMSPSRFFQGIFAVWILSILFKESDGLLYKY